MGMIKKHGKRIRTQRRSKSGNTHRFTQNKTKNPQIWKTPGLDGIYVFWFGKFTSIHDRRAFEMNECLKGAQVPEWVVKGKTTLIQKGPFNGAFTNNYRPINYQPMMWNIQTAKIREVIYYSLTSQGLYPGEQEGSRGTVELLYIDQHILNERKTRWKNLAMARIDYKKSYDMVTQRWIINCLKMYKNLTK